MDSEQTFTMNQRNVEEYFQLYQENLARALPNNNKTKPKKKKESMWRFFFSQVVRGIFSASLSAFFNAFIQSFQTQAIAADPETQTIANDIANINTPLPTSYADV